MSDIRQYEVLTRPGAVVERIASLEAENARLRAALRDLAATGCCLSPGCSVDDPLCTAMSARAALTNAQ